MDLYQTLPEFTGPNMEPEERMAHYRDNIRPYMQYCSLSIVVKLRAWCKHIKEYDLRKAMMKQSSLSSNNTRNQSLLTNITTSTNDSDCYDSYYCNVPSLAGVVHCLMAAIFVVAIVGVLSNLFCFIKMHVKHNRNFVKNSYGLNLATIIIVDCVGLVLISLLYIVPALSGYQHQDQLIMYQRYTVFLVPIMLPLLDLTLTIVAWRVVALLIQRSNITRKKLLKESDGFSSVNVSTVKERQRDRRFLALTIVALFVYTIPKFAEYTFTYDINTGKGIVIPLLRLFKLYRSVYLKFLSPSVECLVPIIVMLAYIAVIKHNEVMLTMHRQRRQSINVDQKDGDRMMAASNAQVLSATGVCRKTQLVIWVSVVVLINLMMKSSDVFVALQRSLEGSPKEDWSKMREITKYLFISISVITVTVKPVIYAYCCPRFFRKSRANNQ